MDLAAGEVHLVRVRADAAGGGRAGSRERLREILAPYANVGPGSLRFETGPQGKPFLPDHPTLRFNLSHSARWWTCAVARDREVGVDVEDLDRRVDVDRIGVRLFAPAELDALGAMEMTIRRRAFFRIWAQREAVVKALGEGMFTCGRSFSVEPDPAKPPRVYGLELALLEAAVDVESVCIVAAEGSGIPRLVDRL